MAYYYTDWIYGVEGKHDDGILYIKDTDEPGAEWVAVGHVDGGHMGRVRQSLMRAVGAEAAKKEAGWLAVLESPNFCSGRGVGGAG